MVDEVGEALDGLVVDFLAGKAFADIEGFDREVAEMRLGVTNMRMIRRVRVRQRGQLVFYLSKQHGRLVRSGLHGILVHSFISG